MDQSHGSCSGCNQFLVWDIDPIFPPFPIIVYHYRDFPDFVPDVQEVLQMPLGPLTIGTAVPDPLPGDFDEDGDVDGFDFLLWQRDPNVGLLSVWETNYGMDLSPLRSALTAFPEPTALLLAALACVGMLVRPSF